MDARSYNYMKGGKRFSKRIKMRKKTNGMKSRDLLTQVHSKRHGTAVKRGIKLAKEIKHLSRRAASVSKGKTRVEVAKEFLAGSTTTRNDLAEGRVSPSLLSVRGGKS